MTKDSSGETSSKASWGMWDEETLRLIGHTVVEQIVHHLVSLPARPTFSPPPPEQIESWREAPLPLEGVDPSAILERFAAEVEPYPFGNGHPSFFGWVNSTPAPMGIWAEALAAALNPSCAGGNHAPVHIEWQVIRWLKELIGWPQEGMGLLVSGGSMATLTGLAVARTEKAGVDIRREGWGGVSQPLTLYCSEEAHSCVQKAVELLGLGSKYLRRIPTDSAFRMDIQALREAVATDRAAGYQPIAVIASAGTVNTGAIDPLEEIADFCAQASLWMHVDAAYGGPAILSSSYHASMRALVRADSVAIDPHKWMYVPVEAGLALVRDPEAMRRTFSLVPSYLQNPSSRVGGSPWFSEFGFQQTRGFRALKVWMVLQSMGKEGLGHAIEADIEHARLLARYVEEDPHLERMAPQSLSIVCFRYAPARLVGDEPKLDRLNQAILAKVQLGGQAFVTSTVLRGRFALRACFVNLRTTEAHIKALVRAVCEAGDAALLEE